MNRGRMVVNGDVDIVPTLKNEMLMDDSPKMSERPSAANLEHATLEYNYSYEAMTHLD